MGNINIHAEKNNNRRYQGEIHVKIDSGVLILSFQGLCTQILELEKTIDWSTSNCRECEQNWQKNNGAKKNFKNAVDEW